MLFKQWLEPQRRRERRPQGPAVLALVAVLALFFASPGFADDTTLTPAEPAAAPQETLVLDPQETLLLDLQETPVLDELAGTPTTTETSSPAGTPPVPETPAASAPTSQDPAEASGNGNSATSVTSKRSRGKSRSAVSISIVAGETAPAQTAGQKPLPIVSEDSAATAVTFPPAVGEEAAVSSALAPVEGDQALTTVASGGVPAPVRPAVTEAAPPAEQASAPSPAPSVEPRVAAADAYPTASRRLDAPLTIADTRSAMTRAPEGLVPNTIAHPESQLPSAAPIAASPLRPHAGQQTGHAQQAGVTGEADRRAPRGRSGNIPAAPAPRGLNLGATQSFPASPGSSGAGAASVSLMCLVSSLLAFSCSGLGRLLPLRGRELWVAAFESPLTRPG